MSVTTQDDLAQAVDALSQLYRMLRQLRVETGDNHRNFALLAEGPLDEIARIQADIDAYVGASHDLAGADLWVRIEGGGIAVSDAPTSVVTAILDALRKGVQSIAELIALGDLSSRPTANIKRAVDFRIVAVAGGSLRVGLKLPDPPDQQTLPGGWGTDEWGSGSWGVGDAAKQAIDGYLAAAEWAGSEDLDDQWLESRIRSARVRRHVLQQLELLVPREKGVVESVELAGPRLGTTRAVRLERGSRKRIRRAVERALPAQVTAEGFIRELDLDKLSLHVRKGEVDETCTFPEELRSTALEAMDHYVRVIGTRIVAPARQKASIAIEDIQVVGGDSYAGEPEPGT